MSASTLALDLGTQTGFALLGIAEQSTLSTRGSAYDARF